MPRERSRVLHAIVALSFCVLAITGCSQPTSTQPPVAPETQNVPDVQAILHVLPLFNYLGGTNGYNPVPIFTGDPTVALYGAMTNGGQHGYGTIFELTPQSGGGQYYTETVLHSFNVTDGSYPASGLASLQTLQSSGYMFGTTQYGGAYGQGTVFKITPSTGAFQTIYSFHGGSDGSGPASLVQMDSAGNLYGTTVQGGVAGCGTIACCPNRCGTVYELSPNGDGTYSEKVIYAFKWGTDGWYPSAGLAPVGKGPYGVTFYGVTFYGGNSDCPGGNQTSPGPNGCGTIYKLQPGPNGYTETVAYRFTEGSTGNRPHSRMLEVNGTFYGTATFGGVQTCASGCGVVYSFVPKTDTYTVLYQFQGGSDGYYPRGGLKYGNGLLYGTTLNGGGSEPCGGATGCGVIFSMTPQGGSYDAFYDSPAPSNGQNPQTTVFEQANTDQLYGTTVAGGKYGYGMLFKVVP